MPETWNGDPITEDDLAKRLKRPARGEFLIERKETRRAITDEEDAEKAKARARDRRCRYPDCPFCRRHKTLIPQAAHVLQAKGMSGDRTGERSTADKLMLLCPPIHGLQEQHRIEIVPLTDAGTFGPCEFWREDEITRQMFLVARETAPFEYERD